MAIKLQELKRRIELEGAEKTTRHFRNALLEGHLKPDDFSIRDLAEATVRTKDGSPCGREYIQSLDPSGGSRTLLESAGAVDSSVFANLTSQLAFAATMEGYEAPNFLHTQLASVRQSKLKKELIPGVTGITEDMEDEVSENMPYQAVGFGEDYRETPATAKRGRILYVTKEAIFHDQTGLILDAARQIGELLGLRKEKQFCRLLLGLVNNYKWRGTTYNTYQTATPWINVKSSNGLVVANGWVQIDASEQLFANSVDPNTGERIVIVPKDIVHMPARKHQFRQVMQATQIRTSQATSGTHVETESRNTLDSYNLYEGRWLYSELVASGVSASDAADWWFHGDIKRAIEWIENWGITMAQLPPNSILEFTQDVALGFKTSTKGVFAIKDPRYVNKNYQA